MSDLTIAKPEISIPKELRDAVLEPDVRDLLSGYGGSYGQSFAGAKELMEADEEGLSDVDYFIPAVRFLVRTSLSLLAQEGISPQLPMEVDDRRMAAHVVIDNLAVIESVGQAIQEAYDSAGMETPAEEFDFNNKETREATAAMAYNAFDDASFLAGGALKLIKDAELAEGEETEIIQGSYGLLRLARVSDIVIPQVRTRLGEPYINTGNLTISDREDTLRVRLTDQTLKLLVDMGYINDESGCPLGKLKSGNVKGNMLQEEWREISGFLVPAGATVDNYKEAE